MTTTPTNTLDNPRQPVPVEQQAWTQCATTARKAGANVPADKAKALADKVKVLADKETITQTYRYSVGVLLSDFS